MSKRRGRRNMLDGAERGETAGRIGLSWLCGLSAQICGLSEQSFVMKKQDFINSVILKLRGDMCLFGFTIGLLLGAVAGFSVCAFFRASGERGR
jgi:hypothetical protein